MLPGMHANAFPVQATRPVVWRSCRCLFALGVREVSRGVVGWWERYIRGCWGGFPAIV